MTNKTWTTIFLVVAGVLALFILSFVFFGESGQLSMILFFGTVGGIVVFLVIWLLYGVIHSIINHSWRETILVSKNFVISLGILSLSIGFFFGFLQARTSWLSRDAVVLDSGNKVQIRNENCIWRNPWITKIDGYVEAEFRHKITSSISIEIDEGKILTVGFEANFLFEIPRENRTFSQHEWASLNLKTEKDMTMGIFEEIVRAKIIERLERGFPLTDRMSLDLSSAERDVFVECLYKPRINYIGTIYVESVKYN